MLTQNCPNYNTIIPFRPKLHGPFSTRFHEKVQSLVRLNSYADIERLILDEVEWSTNECKLNPKQRRIYRSVWLVLRDLYRTGWSIRWHENTLEVMPPDRHTSVGNREESKRVKDTLRECMSNYRKEKIADARDFVYRMENPGQSGLAKLPIHELIADGMVIAKQLRDIAEIADPAERLSKLEHTIKPYLQLVKENERDAVSGHRLIDIWRYFRYSWANPAESTPGRTMQYLIRDAGHPNHPIMGIASLENSAVQITTRDEYIGWTLNTFRKKIETALDEDDIRNEFQQLLSYIQLAILDIDISGLCSQDECDNPTENLILKLAGIAAKSTAEREEALKEWQVKKAEEEEELADRPETSGVPDAAVNALFRRKRAEQLAKLLYARKSIRELLVAENFNDALKKFLASDLGQMAIRNAFVAIKNRHIGTSMMELNVCGAIPPYNSILGGKLVALMMLSPQVVADYRERYGNRASEIASRLKGTSVIRPAELVYLGTTSLYYVGSSQYNRLKLPHRLLTPNGAEVRWKDIGETSGYGTLHISKLTTQTLEEVQLSDDGFSSVNHVFGEGASPKLRMIRQGLAAILDADHNDIDELSKHAMPRIVYGAWLAENGSDYLLGKTDRPDYYFNTEENPLEGTEKIVQFWRERWLLNRIKFHDALIAMENFEVKRLLLSREIPETARIQFTSIPEEVAIMPVDTTEVQRRFFQDLYRGSSGYADRIDINLLNTIHVETQLDQAIIAPYPF